MEKTRISALVFSAMLALALCGCGKEQSAAALPTVYINELMASNKAALADGAGGFPDWLELYNPGEAELELTGWSLTDGSQSWTFPEYTIPAGSYRVLFCGAELPFALAAEGETVTLLSPSGETADSFSYSQAQADVSYIKDGAGNIAPCRFPTPGFENGDAGYEALQAALPVPELAINEVTVFDRLSPAPDGSYPDMVELRNNGGAPVDLSGYFLSDKGGDRLLYRLPERILAPGELCLVSLDGSAPFSLGSGQEQLYLTSEDGSLADYVSLHDIPYGGSCGRQPGEGGWFYFSAPSLGGENGGGARLISQKPAAAEPDGVFDGSAPVTVTLNGPGDIYYTLDGSTPTVASARYTQPLTLNATGVVRAICAQPGKLPSASLDLSYIIGEGHSLPVASLVIDPENMFGGGGIYANPGADWERQGSIAFFDGDGRFSLSCGVKIHGATSRFAQAKKSMKLNFREVYGGELDYDLFENGVTSFSSVLLRAAQEGSFSTNIRDILMHQLAAQCSGALSVQDYKYCILYINGEYWGIYAFREAHSPEHFARHFGYADSEVDMWQEKWAVPGDFNDIYNFILSSDMGNNDNYNYAIAHIDAQSLITWAIIESYSGNIDINSPNIRFYYSRSDGVLHYALVDLDLGLFAQGRFSQSLVTGYDFNNLVLRLLDNGQFRQLMLESLSEYLAGPLSAENVCATLDGLAAQLRPETERDGARWGYTTEQWELQLQTYMYDFVNNYGQGSYAVFLADGARAFLNVGSEEYQRYFGQLGK